MKKFKFSFIFLVAILAIGCSTGTDIPDRPVEEVIIEVASAIRYYPSLVPTAKNLYTSENEFEGQCADYSLLFALKTKAQIIVTNQDKQLKMDDGIYRVVGKDPIKSNFEDLFNWDGTLDSFGRHRSTVYHFVTRDGERWGLYHPMIGAYVLRKVADFTPRNKDKHIWNLLDGVEIDVNKFDCQGSWKVSK